MGGRKLSLLGGFPCSHLIFSRVELWDDFVQGTGNLEWYDPEAITTEGGSLVITLSKKVTHGLNYEGGSCFPYQGTLTDVR